MNSLHEELINTPQEELLTKEFFTTFKSRTNNGDIAELYTTASWDDPVHNQDNTTESDKGILKELRKYYSWLYSEKPSLENEAPLKTLRDRPLQESDIKLMERPVTLYECRQAIHRLGLAKSAGPDGLPAEFYKSFEELVVRDLHNTFLEAHATGALPPTMREGDIVLLYKKGDSRDPRNYRPITLLQVDYKILAKILVARMKKTVNNFVSKEQLGFVPKRLIGEATHLLNKLGLLPSCARSGVIHVRADEVRAVLAPDIGTVLQTFKKVQNPLGVVHAARSSDTTPPLQTA
eukprot:scaffold5791_cov117-Isochrysis_galbana.AAC.1